MPYSYKLTAKDGSRKYVFDMGAGLSIEAAYFEVPSRERPYVACVSTQVGCAVGCLFCATTATPFSRNLSSDEIVHQIGTIISEEGLLSAFLEQFEVSFMGMGEPLSNLDNLLTAVDTLGQTYPRISRVSVSTSGPSKRIHALTDAMPTSPPVHLQISLHATKDETRQHLVPHAPDSIENLLQAGLRFHKTTGDHVCLNYVLIRGLNDSLEDAEWLTSLDKEAFYVKLSALNPVLNMPVSFSAPSPGQVREFSKILAASGIPHKLFTGDGIDIAASCGQLAASKQEICSPATLNAL